jgi:hypothetical protein
MRAPGIEPGFKAWKALVITPRPHPQGEVGGDMLSYILILSVIGVKGIHLRPMAIYRFNGANNRN